MMRDHLLTSPTPALTWLAPAQPAPRVTPSDMTRGMTCLDALTILSEHMLPPHAVLRAALHLAGVPPGAPAAEWPDGPARAQTLVQGWAQEGAALSPIEAVAQWQGELRTLRTEVARLGEQP